MLNQEDIEMKSNSAWVVAETPKFQNGVEQEQKQDTLEPLTEETYAAPLQI